VPGRLEPSYPRCERGKVQRGCAACGEEGCNGHHDRAWWWGHGGDMDSICMPCQACCICIIGNKEAIVQTQGTEWIVPAWRTHSQGLDKDQTSDQSKGCSVGLYSGCSAPSSCVGLLQSTLGARIDAWCSFDWCTDTHPHSAFSSPEQQNQGPILSAEPKPKRVRIVVR
jgi:hypothetical protein